MRSQIPSSPPRRASSFGPAIIVAFVLVMCLSLTMGYLVTKYIVYPFILKQDLSATENPPLPGTVVIDENEVPQGKPYDPDDSIVTNGASSDDEKVPADNNTPSAVASPPPPADSSAQANSSSPAQSTGSAAAVYYIQLGSLTTKTAADELASGFKSKGLNCSVKEINGVFKVLGESYSSKDEARAHLPAISTVVPDAFVTTLQP